MGVGHGHGHGAGPTDPSASGRHRWRLALAFSMVAVFFVVELLVGISASSLALISDAGHMATDVVALGAALTAIRIAARPDSSGRRTYGSYRAEIFASGLTVLIMLGVSAYVVVEAVRRIGTSDSTVSVASGPMLVVGAIGLMVNAASILLLRGGSGESLNVKAAYYEVVADAAGSVGVLAAGGLIVLTGQSWWDTAVALAIGVFVAFRAVVLGRQVLTVLGQHVPAGMDIEQAAADLAAVPGVRDVHDLHAWSLTSGMNVATAHLVIEDDASAGTVLREAQTVLQAKHQIEHATLQVEDEPTRQCHETSW